jgi:hypothetical protein
MPDHGDDHVLPVARAAGHARCTRCRLRFTPAEAASREACPCCAGAIERTAGPAEVLGLPLFPASTQPVAALPAAPEQALAHAVAEARERPWPGWSP